MKFWKNFFFLTYVDILRKLSAKYKFKNKHLTTCQMDLYFYKNEDGLNVYYCGNKHGKKCFLKTFKNFDNVKIKIIDVYQLEKDDCIEYYI